MRLSLPEETLRDGMVWGFRPDFDDEAYLRALDSPRWDERFGDADHPLPDGRRLDEIVRELCGQADVCQPLIWAKFIGETSFLTARTPPGKGYKAPLGFDCPDGGRDPRPRYYGVVPNIRGAINWWGEFKQRWEWQRRLRDGVAEVNVLSERAGVQRETVRARSAAEVAYLIYTPHLYSLHDFMAILARSFPSLLKEELPTPGDPRLIVAKPADDATSIDGLVYLEVPSRWNHAEGLIEADTRALGVWLNKDPSGLPDFEHIREALEHMGVSARYDLTHLSSDTNPRIYVFTT